MAEYFTGASDPTLGPSSVLPHRLWFLRRPGTWLLAGLALVIGAGLAVPVAWAIQQPGLDIQHEVVEDFNAGHLACPQPDPSHSCVDTDRLLSVTGFHSGSQGWYLAPGSSGELVYRVPASPGRQIHIALWLYTGAGVHTEVDARSPGLAPAVVGRDLSVAGTDIPLLGGIGNGVPVELRFRAQSSSPGEVLVIDQLVTFDATGATPHAPPRLAYLGLALIAFGIALPLVRPRRHALAIAAGVGVVVGLAALLRLTALFDQAGPLDPDAVGYRIYGDRFQFWPLSANGIFSGNFAEREPLFVAAVHSYFAVLGSSDLHLRVVSSTLSIAVVAAALVVTGRRLRSWPARLAVGLLLAANGPLIVESARGLRLELEMLTVLALYFVLDRRPARRPWLEAGLIGLVAAAVVLTRTYFLPMVVVAVAISYLARYRPVGRSAALAAVVLLIMFSAAAGHRIGLYQRHGDPFWDMGGYARWNANVEKYAYGRPLPHPELFPTAEEYQRRGPYFGPPLSNFQYLLIVHSPGEFLHDTVAGYAEIFLNSDGFGQVPSLPGPGATVTAHLGPRVDLAARWLALWGLVALTLRGWRRRRLLLVPAMVVGSLAFAAFLYDHGLTERYRHTDQTLPLAWMAGAWLVESGVQLVRQRQWSALSGGWWRRGGALLTPLLAPGLALLTVLLAVGVRSAPFGPRPLAAAVVLLAAAAAAAVLLDPVLGALAAVLAIAVLGPRAAAAVALAAVIAGLARERLRPPPAVAATAAFALALVFSGLGSMPGWRPLGASLYMGITAIGVVCLFAVVAAAGTRDRILRWLAVAGPVAGVLQVVEPATPVLVGLLPVSLVAAGALAIRGGARWAFAAGLLTATLMVPLEPLPGTLAALAGLALVVVASWRPPARTAALGALAAAALLLVAGSLLAAPGPSQSSWRAYLADPAWTVRQRIDGGAGDSVWVFGRISSRQADLQVELSVNGSQVADLATLLPTDRLGWTRVPLPAARAADRRLDVAIKIRGPADAQSRYAEIGGVYAHSSALVPEFDGAGEAAGDLSPDAGIQRGAYLVLRGTNAVPQPPPNFPAPFVGTSWQPATGVPLAGEEGALPAARAQAGTLDLWAEAADLTRSHPWFGIGTSRLGDALVVTDPGAAPGLTARDQLLQTAAEAGLLGMLGLLVAPAVGVVAAWRLRDPVLGALLLTVLLPLTLVSVLAAPGWAVAVWMVIGMALAPTALPLESARVPRQ